MCKRQFNRAEQKNGSSSLIYFHVITERSLENPALLRQYYYEPST